MEYTPFRPLRNLVRPNWHKLLQTELWIAPSTQTFSKTAFRRFKHPKRGKGVPNKRPPPWFAASCCPRCFGQVKSTPLLGALVGSKFARYWPRLQIWENRKCPAFKNTTCWIGVLDLIRFDTTHGSVATPQTNLQAIEMTLAGLEPAIFGSEDQRLIH